jgi:hypothetical protein
VRECVCNNFATRLPLETVVADGGCGADCLLEIALFDNLFASLGVVCPHSG